MQGLNVSVHPYMKRLYNWISFSTLFSAQKENIVSTLSRFLLIVQLFVMLILNSTYTASLSSSNDPIGYQKGSFARSYLTNEQRVQPSRLVALKSPEEFEKALVKGPQKGGVVALVDEYMELFLSTRCEFAMVGQDFAKLGCGFACQRDSPLAVDISTAILKALREWRTLENSRQVAEAKCFQHTRCKARNRPLMDDKITYVHRYSWRLPAMGII